MCSSMSKGLDGRSASRNKTPRHSGDRRCRGADPHPSRRYCRGRRRWTGLSVVKAAGALGVWPNQRNNVVSGKSNILPAMDVRLEMALGGAADTWPRAQNNCDIARARNIVANIQKIVSKNKEPA